MARMLTEEEVQKIEEQRALRDRVKAAGSTAGMSWIEKERLSQQQLNDRFKQAHADAMERRRLNVLADPAAEANTNYRHSVMRDAELRAAHERGMDVHRGEWDTRLKEAKERRRGLREKGSDATKIRADAEKDMLGLNLADKEKQRQHEIVLLKQNQEFTGAQNTAERQNKLDVAGVQGRSAVEAARAQAEARAADLAQKDALEREKLRSREEIEKLRIGGKLTLEGEKRLAQTYRTLLNFNGNPERTKKALLEQGWTEEEITRASGRKE